MGSLPPLLLLKQVVWALRLSCPVCIEMIRATMPAPHLLCAPGEKGSTAEGLITVGLSQEEEPK